MERSKSTADKLLEIQEKQAAMKKQFQEEIETLKKCANKIFSTKEGKFWAKRAFIVLDVNRREQAVFNNLALMAAEKARRDFYLQFFKELLDPEVLTDIERGQ